MIPENEELPNIFYHSLAGSGRWPASYPRICCSRHPFKAPNAFKKHVYLAITARVDALQ